MREVEQAPPSTALRTERAAHAFLVPLPSDLLACTALRWALATMCRRLAAKADWRRESHRHMPGYMLACATERCSRRDRAAK